MILLIDNFDSFVYNLNHYIMETGRIVRVVRNDAITIQEIEALNPDAIVLSPGPCGPNEAGICLDLVRNFYNKIPILGVCLGHQVIGQVMGGTVVRAITPIHGKTESIHHDGVGVFKDIPSPTQITRYHSLVVHMDGAKDLTVTSVSKDGEIMAFQHNEYPVYGVQFHPEAVMTVYGRQMVRNFLDIVKNFNGGMK